MRVVMLGSLAALGAGCAVLGFQVPCETDDGCPTGVCVDGLCNDGEPKGCRGAVKDPTIRIVDAEGESDPDGLCFTSLNDALTHPADDAVVIQVAPGTYPVTATLPDAVVTIAGTNRDTVVLVGEAPLFELREHALTLKTMTIGAEQDDNDTPWIIRGEDAIDELELHVEDATVRPHTGGGISVEATRAVLRDVTFERDAFVRLRSLETGTHEIVRARFEAARLILADTAPASITEVEMVLQNAEPGLLAAAGLVTINGILLEAPGPCTEGIRLVSGGLTLRGLRVGTEDNGLLPCPAVHALADATPDELALDLGTTDAAGDNHFQGASPAVRITSMNANGPVTVPALGNTWNAGVPACDDDIEIVTAAPVRVQHAATPAYCTGRCGGQVGDGAFDTVAVVADGIGVGCYLTLAAALVESPTPSSIFLPSGTHPVSEDASTPPLITASVSFLGEERTQTVLTSTVGSLVTLPDTDALEVSLANLTVSGIVNTDLVDENGVGGLVVLRDVRIVDNGLFLSGVEVFAADVEFIAGATLSISGAPSASLSGILNAANAEFDGSDIDCFDCVFAGVGGPALTLTGGELTVDGVSSFAGDGVGLLHQTEGAVDVLSATFAGTLTTGVYVALDAATKNASMVLGAGVDFQGAEAIRIATSPSTYVIDATAVEWVTAPTCGTTIVAATGSVEWDAGEFCPTP